MLGIGWCGKANVLLSRKTVPLSLKSKGLGDEVGDTTDRKLQGALP